MVLDSDKTGSEMTFFHAPRSSEDFAACFFYASGIAAASIGAAALTVWHSEATPLYSVQHVPYGTAFGLVFYGIAVCLLGLKRFAIADIFATALLVLSSVRLFEFLLRSSLQLELFFSHYGVVAEPHRMGAVTAVSFLLLAAALIALARSRPGKPALITVALIATAVLAISLTMLAASISQRYGLYDWVPVWRVQIPAALVLLVLSASLIAYVFATRRDPGISIARSAPLAAGLGIFVGALMLWQALVLWESRRIQQDITWAAHAVNSQLKTSVREQVAVLERLAARWEIYEPTEQQWRADVNATVRSTYFLGVAWFDTSLRPRWSSLPDDADVKPPVEQTPSLSAFFVLQSGKAALRVFLPVSREGGFDGVVVGTLDVRELLRDILLETEPGFSVALFEGDRLIVSLNEQDLALAKPWGVEEPVALYNGEWVIRVAPASEYLEVAHASLPEVVLVSGLLVATLLAAAVFFYQSARARALEAEKANVQLARETEERKQASFALAQSEARLSGIMEQAQDAIISYDSEQRITRFNRAAEKIFGVGAHDVLGQPVQKLVPDNGEAMLESHEPRETIAGAAGQRSFPVEVSVSSSDAGEETLYTAVFRDISERKKIERQTREAMEYYFRLFTDFPTLVRRSDLSGQCDYCNDAWLKYTGRTSEQELGAGWMQGVHPDDAELCFKTYARGFDLRQPVEIEYRLRRRDGEYGWVRDFGKPAYDLEGKFISYLNACYDITESKRSHLQLERSRKQLRALSAHLQTVREEEKLKLARELHDEFGAKLTALKLDLGWLTIKLPPDPAVRDKASAMAAALDTALNAMRRMWSELRPSVLDDLGLIVALKWEAREFRKIWRIPVLVRAEPEEEDVPPEIALVLYRILQEALANIAVHAKAGHVFIGFRATEASWTLEVRDDGVGVDERRILTEDAGGYGLTAMFERARALNGIVTVKRATGQGTIVTATIPRPVPKRDEAKSQRGDVTLS